MLKIAKRAVGGGEIPQRGAARIDRRLKRAPDRPPQSFGPPRPDRRRRAARRYARLEQCLADIDIAKPRHHRLIEKGGLYRRAARAQRIGQHAEGESLVQRLRSHGAKMLRAFNGGGPGEVHETETARVVEYDARPPGRAAHEKLDMIVGAGGRARRRTGLAARILRAGFDNEPARHAEMHDQAFIR